MSDKELIAEFQKGDMSALGVLYDRYKQMIILYAMRLGADNPQDILQEVFIKLIKHPNNYSPEYDVKPFLLRSTKQRVITQYHYHNAKKRKGIELSMNEDREIPMQVADDTRTPEQIMQTNMEIERAEKKLKSMPAIFSQVILMRVYGYGYQEISDILNVNLNTVKTRIHRARQAL